MHLSFLNVILCSCFFKTPRALPGPCVTQVRLALGRGGATCGAGRRGARVQAQSSDHWTHSHSCWTESHIASAPSAAPELRSTHARQLHRTDRFYARHSSSPFHDERSAAITQSALGRLRRRGAAVVRRRLGRLRQPGAGIHAAHLPVPRIRRPVRPTSHRILAGLGESTRIHQTRSRNHSMSQHTHRDKEAATSAGVTSACAPI